MKETIIFHSPVLVEREAKSGSVVRPIKMLDAFNKLNINVFLVDGDSKNRKQKWEELRRRMKNVIGVYSELSTMPIALSDPDHFPRRPFQDMAWFRKLRKSGIPVAAFYRDVHWRFPQYKRITTFQKRIVAKAFYHLELRQLVRSVSHVFLPSLRMAPFVPVPFSEGMVSALPPGALIQGCRGNKVREVTRLLYVGGVTPPLYDLKPMIQSVRNTMGIELTVCCREAEWGKVRDYYGGNDGLSVVHYFGERINKLFLEADGFLMFRQMDPYLRFAMPVKLFEAIGYGLPIICNASCEMGDFVEKKGVGWAVESEVELTELLNRLKEDPSVIDRCAAVVREQRHFHTWRMRAEEVIGTLERCRQRGKI